LNGLLELTLQKPSSTNKGSTYDITCGETP